MFFPQRVSEKTLNTLWWRGVQHPNNPHTPSRKVSRNSKGEQRKAAFFNGTSRGLNGGHKNLGAVFFTQGRGNPGPGKNTVPKPCEPTGKFRRVKPFTKPLNQVSGGELKVKGPSKKGVLEELSLFVLFWWGIKKSLG